MNPTATVWMLGYEMAGSTAAAWTLRHGDPDGENDIYEATDAIPEDAPPAAREWAAACLATLGTAVDGWEPWSPAPGIEPTYWMAIEAPAPVEQEHSTRDH